MDPVEDLKDEQVQPVGTFVYESIDLDRDTFRLLSILPSKDENDPIQCFLRHEPLESGVYSCLSYTWGSDPATVPIFVNNKAFLVRGNLHSFLQQARRSRICESIWIDAICINQTNDAERGHAVRLMAQIYRNAQQVFSWLGSGCKDVEAAIRIVSSMKTLSSAKYDPWSVFETVWTPFQMACQLPYWSRLWIIQEVFLACEVHIMYGTVSVPFSLMAKILPFVKMRLSRGYRHYRNTEAQVNTLWHESGIGVVLGSRSGSVRSKPLLELISKFKGSHCTDKRDRVYGLLGIASDSLHFEINYAENRARLAVRLLRCDAARSRGHLVKAISDIQLALEVDMRALLEVAGISSHLIPSPLVLKHHRFGLVAVHVLKGGEGQLAPRKPWSIYSDELCRECLDAFQSSVGWWRIPEMAKDTNALSVALPQQLASPYQRSSFGGGQEFGHLEDRSLLENSSMLFFRVPTDDMTIQLLGGYMEIHELRIMASRTSTYPFAYDHRDLYYLKSLGRSCCDPDWCASGEGFSNVYPCKEELKSSSPVHAEYLAFEHYIRSEWQTQ